MLEFHAILEVILTLCGPAFAIMVMVKLAPAAYLIARGSHDPTLMYLCAVVGLVLIAVSFIAMAIRGMFAPEISAFFFSAPVIVLPICAGAAALISTLPYWLVRVFRPESMFFEKLDRTLAARWNLSRYTDLQRDVAHDGAVYSSRDEDFR